MKRASEFHLPLLTRIEKKAIQTYNPVSLGMFHVKHSAGPITSVGSQLALVRAWLPLSSAGERAIRSFHEQVQRLANTARLTGTGLVAGFFQSHILPALCAWRLIRPHQGARIADVGAGAGSFAVTAASVYPAASIFAIDSSRRHCDFMGNVVAGLSMENLTVLCDRVERLSGHPELQERFDIVGCRAVASGTRPYELARLLLRPGGSLLLWRTYEQPTQAAVVPFRRVCQLDLGALSPRLTLARYDVLESI